MDVVERETSSRATRSARDDASAGAPKKRSNKAARPGWSAPTRWLLRVVLLAAVLGLWTLWGSTPTGSRVVGTPLGVATELSQWPTDSGRLDDMAATGEAAAWGFLIGVSLGFATAFASSFIPVVGRFLAPFIAAIHAMPKVALGSAFIVAFGLGITSKVMFVVSLIFFVIFFPIYDGLGDVSDEVVNHARVLGASRLGLLRAVYIPASLIWMTTGLRLAVTFSILGAAAGEYLGATRGVGHVIRQAMFYGEGVVVMAGVAVLSLTSLLLDRLLVIGERRFSGWRLF